MATHGNIKITTGQKCGCCHRLAVDPAADAFDDDLDAHVCPDCRVKLRAATAWLRTANIRNCTKARNH